MKNTGRVHSIETFGTVDGPGIRFVAFMQGCALRCQYCHNPDTWDLHEGYKVTIDQLLAEIEPYINYYRSSGGGLTVSGGEPTLQAAFVAELFRQVKARFNLHTTLDTNGYNHGVRVDELLELTDLVLLDIKHIDSKKHEILTGVGNEKTLSFAKWCSENGQKMWIRHVYVPGIHNQEEDLIDLGEFVSSLNHVEKFEILPYHQMGVYKWKKLGKDYPLEGVPTPSEEEIARAYALIEEGMKKS